MELALARARVRVRARAQVLAGLSHFAILPSLLGTKYAREVIFHPMRPVGYHFKPLFKVFAAMFRPNAPHTEK